MLFTSFCFRFLARMRFNYISVLEASEMWLQAVITQ